MRHIGHDPYFDKAAAAQHGIEWLPLDEMPAEADFVCICCNLSDETHHLINAPRLALMKHNAYLINVARGPIVDQQALTVALQERRIAGAGLDVFEQEPIDPADPLLKLDNVVLAPHALCWTDECFAGNGRSACQSILDVAAGRAPQHIVNRPALEHPRWSK
jgi:phosphoglycerate dehydrogenase-like enzyme